MFPYLDLGPLHLGTFGLLLWLAAVVGTYVLHRNFLRNGVGLDALNIVVTTVILGIVGAKLWHELQNPRELVAAWRQILLPGLAHPVEIVLGFLSWFKAGFAWFGGLVAGVATLIAQGMSMHPNGLRGSRAGLRILDLAAPATAIGYGVGRIGCLTSGDGDYGIVTTLPWGVHIRPDALDPPQPDPPGLLVQPTPVYELLFALVLGWWLWKRGAKRLPLGVLTGEYLALSGLGRFLVEFVRINPRLYWGMSNAQVAALGSVVAGLAMMLVCRNNMRLAPESGSAANASESAVVA